MQTKAIAKTNKNKNNKAKEVIRNSFKIQMNRYKSKLRREQNKQSVNPLPNPNPKPLQVP